jgi:hypothetical protein
MVGHEQHSARSDAPALRVAERAQAAETTYASPLGGHGKVDAGGAASCRRLKGARRSVLVAISENGIVAAGLGIGGELTPLCGDLAHRVA